MHVTHKATANDFVSRKVSQNLNAPFIWPSVSQSDLSREGDVHASRRKPTTLKKKVSMARMSRARLRRLWPESVS
jgi:hypothetical protein